MCKSLCNFANDLVTLPSRLQGASASTAATSEKIKFLCNCSNLFDLYNVTELYKT